MTWFVLIITFFVIYFIYKFDKTNIPIEKLVLIALLTAIACVGRIIFSGIASVQPSSFIVIITGIVLGKKEGAITGILLGVLSNLILGFGPYVLWQCFSWGLMGFLAGLFSNILRKNMLILLIYSFLWGILFGFIMNTSTIYMMQMELNVKTMATLMILSFPMDVAHGISNFLLVLFLSKKFISVLDRISIKYGLTPINIS